MPLDSPIKRLILKLSGESIADDSGFGIDPQKCLRVAEALKYLQNLGMHLGLVIGGGNVIRGISASSLGIERTPADQMGMLATVINGKALQNALEKIEAPTALFTALECPRVAETYTWHRAKEAFEEGKILLFVGGTGNPFFSTDSAAALRASELEVDCLLKATKVSGVFDKDPKRYPDATKYDRIPFRQFISEGLEVMDITSVIMCMHAKIPIIVMNMAAVIEKRVVETLEKSDQITVIQGE